MIVPPPSHQSGDPTLGAAVQEGMLGPSLETVVVIGQMGQSLDGRIAGPRGERRVVNGEAGLDHLHHLRAQVDAVVIGVGTALADDPQLTVRRVPGRNPARVVIDPRRRLPASAKLFADDGTRRIVITRAAAAPPLPDGVDLVDVPGEGDMAPRAIIAALVARGLRRLLIEGGARTLGAFVRARCIDRLHLMVAPVTLGAGPRSLVESVETFCCDGVRPPVQSRSLGTDMLYEIDLSAHRS